METISKKLYCPLLRKDIEVGYCWELCNIGDDSVLLPGDIVEGWHAAQQVCRECGEFEDDKSW